MRKRLAVALVFAGSVVLVSAAARTKSPDYSRFQKKLPKDEQVLHALDRLTFGPRPGDVAAVKKMGLKKWIDLQLHPERIKENPELSKKLDPLKSLRMSPGETVAAYPTPQMARAVMQGRQRPPTDPIMRAAVERMERRFQSGGNNPGPMEPVAPLNQILTRDQIRMLRTGDADQERELLASIPKQQIDNVVIALPPRMRNRLMPAAAPDLQRKLMLANAPQQLVFFDLAEAKLYRAILSNRQLQEELVDFWYNHFNIFIDKGQDRYLVASYERDAIRPHVLGHFRDLLEATATSPAMLFYLDNWQSVAPDRVRRPNARAPRRGLNENYGRELMELQTLGVDGGYTQKDVIEVARCFTGWTIRNPQQGGGFFYNDRVHDKGEKVVLGVKIPAGGGRDDGEKVLDLLANRPSTAHFISKELAQRFVADDPPPALVDRMAKTFLKTHGDLREVMKTMLTSKEFFSQGAYHAKVKTPFEMVASAVRATGAQVDYAFGLAQQVGQLGEPLYRKIEPNGYSNLNTEWVSSASLLGRMNFALALAGNKFPGVKVDPSSFPADPMETAHRILSADPAPQTRDAISNAAPAQVAGLVIGSPDFQRR